MLKRGPVGFSFIFLAALWILTPLASGDNGSAIGPIIVNGAFGTLNAVSPLISGTNSTAMINNGRGGSVPTVMTNSGFGGIGGGFGFGVGSGYGGGPGFGGYGQGGYQYSPAVANPWLSGAYPPFAGYGGGGFGAGAGWGYGGGGPGFGGYGYGGPGYGGFGGGGGWGPGYPQLPPYFGGFPMAPCNPGWPMAGSGPDVSQCVVCPGCSDTYEPPAIRERGPRIVISHDPSPPPASSPAKLRPIGVVPERPLPPVKELPEVPLPPNIGDGGGDYQPVKDQSCEDKRSVAFNKTEGTVCTTCLVKKPAPPIEALGALHIIVGNQSLARGAEDVMAVFYQDCRVITEDDAVICSGDQVQGVNGCDDKPCRRQVDRTDYKRYLASQPYLAQLCRIDGSVKTPTNQACVNICDKAPLFNYSGRAHLENNKIDVHHEHEGLNHDGIGMDCSAFIAASMARMGLKATPTDGSTKMPEVSTDSLLASVRNSASTCFVPLNKSKAPLAINSGDVFVFKYGSKGLGHAFVVDSVGGDPFGVAAMLKQKCADGSFSPKNFDFMIIQSAANARGAGIQKIPASTYLARSDSFPKGPIEQMAMAQCRAQLDNAKSPTAYEAPDAAGKSPQFAILRHKSTAESLGVSAKDAAACRGPKKMPLKNAECENVKRCLSAD